MSSFQALKTKRDARHIAHTSSSTSPIKAQTTSDLAQASTSAPPSNAEASSSKANDADPRVYSLTPTLELKQSPSHGRSLYTKKSVRSGSRLLRTKPLVAVNSTRNLPLYCSGCHLSPQEVAISKGPGATEPSLKRCVGCKVVYYCSQACQAGDWTWHKEECAAHKRLRGEYTKATGKNGDDGRWIMNERFRALARLCWARRTERKGGKGKDPDWWDQVQRMESHLGRLPQEQVVQLGHQVQRFRQYLFAADNDWPGLANMEDYAFSSASELLNLFSAFEINSFTLSSPSLSPIGVAMSPLVALCNHSCEPNAVVVFPEGGKGMDVVAIRSISPGEEILTSYIDVSLPYDDRQADLQKRYGFKCDCSLCTKSDSDWIDPRWCMVAQGKDQGIISMPASSLMPEDLRKLVERGKSILRKDEDGSLDPEEATDELSRLIPQLSQRFPSSAHPLLGLLRLRSLLLTPPKSPEDREAAIVSLAAAYAGAEKVYPVGHPTLAIMSAEWSKLAAMGPSSGPGQDDTKRLREAIVGLRKTVQACEVGFGPRGGLVGKEMSNLLRQCELELSHAR